MYALDGSIEKDFEKNKDFVEKGVSQYEIVMATHSKVSLKTLNEKSKYEGVIKYYNDIKKYINEENSLKNIMNGTIEKKFKAEDGYEIVRCELNSGNAFDLEVLVYFWIIQ